MVFIVVIVIFSSPSPVIADIVSNEIEKEEQKHK